MTRKLFALLAFAAIAISRIVVVARSPAEPMDT